jgi:serine/threonine protein kinase
VSEGSPTEEFGPYIVYERLGVGGMAQVHRAIATNDAFRRPVALKRMLSHIADSEEMVKAFVREARLASYLRHENVAQTYDLGKVGGTYFIVMELITGRNLREVLKHCGVTTGPMPVPVALNILNQICDALDYAHNLRDEAARPLGIIHRDVSPSNVIVSDSGVVKLIDFGIAKASAAGMQTMGGMLKGKFAYMAPEYIDGHIDARADLFAIGVIAHELLTNRPLFSGRDDIDTLTRVRDMHIAPPSKKNPLVPPEIDDVVMTALARDPERRWQHATALRTAMTTLTQRLDLVASNAQVIQWLDWAFSHEPTPQVHTDRDTEIDARPISDDASVSREPRTVKLSAMSPKVTLGLRDREPQPPKTTPLGTPAHAPAHRTSTPAPAARPGKVDRNRRISGLAPPTTSSVTLPLTPNTTTNAVTMPLLRPSGSYAARARSSPSSSSSSPSIALPDPPAAAPIRPPAAASVPPPAAPVPPAAAPAPAPRGLPAIPVPTAQGSQAVLVAEVQGFQPAPAAAVQGFQPVPAAVVQGSQPLPATVAQGSEPASAPAAQGSQVTPAPAATIDSTAPPAPTRPDPQVPAAPAASESTRSPAVPRDPAPWTSAVSGPPARGSYVLAVVLVVLAAALAAITVYFVLPLLT